MTRSELLDRLLCIFFPARCVLCETVVEYERLLCGACEFTRRGTVDCSFAPGLTGALSALEYTGAARGAILRLKEHDDLRTVRFFAGEMCADVREYWAAVAFDCVVPVPCTAASLAKRGYDHAERLASAIAAALLLPVFPNALTRRGDTAAQHNLSREMRFINARKSYGIGDGDAVKGKTVLLADDIFTTGATLSACADELFRAGAKAVYAVTAAYTPKE